MQIGLDIDQMIGLIDELDLFAILFYWRHFECPSQTIVEGNRRLDAPGVAEVDVVIRYGALIRGRGERRIQGKVRPTAGVSLLGYGHDAQSRSVVATKVFRGNTCW